MPENVPHFEYKIGCETCGSECSRRKRLFFDFHLNVKIQAWCPTCRKTVTHTATADQIALASYLKLKENHGQYHEGPLTIQ